METHALDPLREFAPGSTVMYGLHGKCVVHSIEERKIGDSTVPFFRLEIQKSTLSRSTRQEPAIWVPISAARTSGLRAPMDGKTYEFVMNTLGSREFYFDLSLSWSKAQHLLERAIAIEGAVGLAKAMSYVFGIKKREVILSTEAGRFWETISKLLLREMSEFLNIPIKDAEAQVNRALKNKLLPDH